MLTRCHQLQNGILRSRAWEGTMIVARNLAEKARGKVKAKAQEEESHSLREKYPEVLADLSAFARRRTRNGAHSRVIKQRRHVLRRGAETMPTLLLMTCRRHTGGILKTSPRAHMRAWF